jgi:pimeloyl-ACP methyl ester carboxylesterase
MLHGFMGTTQSHFSNQISYLEGRYELIKMDLPGHGDSTIEPSENYIEDTLEYLYTRMKEEGESYILGLSLGASLAIHIALRKPELVKGIVLTGYSPFIPEELKEIMENQNEYFLNIEKNDAEIAHHFHQLHGEKWKETIRKVLHTMTFDYPAVTMKDLQSLKTPVFILNGSHDVHEVESVAYIKKTNPDIEIGLIPNAGHTANIDEPELFNSTLQKFLDRIR